MADRVGKKFEEKFQKSWERTLPKTIIRRIPDQQSKYKGQSSNECDFLGFTNHNLFMIECKTTQETNLNIKADFKQYPLLSEIVGFENVHAGVIIWYYTYDLVVWVPIEEVNRMVSEGKKSIHKNDLLSGEYKCVFIPFEKPRVYPKMNLWVFNEIE